MPKSYEDGMKVIVGFGNLDLATDRQGDWASLANYDSCSVLYLSDVGHAGEDVTVSLRQATSAAGAGAKALTGPRWYGEQSATVAQVTGDTIASLGLSSFTDDGETACFARCEITADMLDVSGGFSYVQIEVSDPGNTAGKLASALYVLQGARHSVDVPNQPAAAT